jgi:beta-mannosidase
MSDAVVDYYFTKKLAYHYIKRSQQEFAIAAGEITNWELPIYACNDTMEKKQVKLTVSYADTDEVIFSSEFTVGENRSECIAKIPVYYSDKRVLIFKWEANGESGINHYLCGYPPFSLNEYASVMKKHGLL